jgi:hypothetical protein
MDIDPVEQRSGDFGDIALDHRRRAKTFVRFVVEIATGTRVISLLQLPCSICRFMVAPDGFD